MQGSRVAKLATVGVLTILLLGVWTITAIGSPDDSMAASMVVPSGRYGDRAEYAFEDVHHMHDENGDDRTHPLDGESLRRLVAWELTGPHPVVDRYGRPHEAVRIDLSMHWLTRESNVFTGWPGQDYLDLDSRQSIRMDRLTSQTYADPFAGVGEGLTYNLHLAETSLGPHPFTSPDDQVHRAVAHLQGLVLVPGHDLSDRVGIPGIVEPDPTFTIQQSVSVGEPARFLDQRVIPVTITSLRQWDNDDELENAWTNVTLWFSESAPVPLRIETAWGGFDVAKEDGDYDEWSGRAVATLTAFRRGSSELGWGPTRAEGLGSHSGIPSGQPHPTSGDDWRGAFRLEEAIASVESDPSLVAFKLWQQENAGWRLVGFDGWPGQMDGMGRYGGAWPFGDEADKWRLHYSAPFGSTIMVIDSIKPKHGAILNSVADPEGMDVPPDRRFDPAWLPDSFTVLSEADKFWKALATPETYAKGPNYARWGYGYNLASDPRHAMHNIMSYGRVNVLEPHVAPFNTSVVRIDPSSGAFHSGIHEFQFPNWTGSVLPASARIDEQISSTPDVSPRVDLLPLTAAATASLLMLLAVYLFPLVQQGAIGLYSKLVKNQLLDHALRDQLIALIRENPGISPPALKHLTDAGWSTIIYHLSVLRDNNLVTSVRQGRHRRYFLVGAINQSQLAETALLKNERTRQVFELVRAQPGCDRSTLARLTGLAVTPVVWHLERLQSQNLIRVEKRGRTVAYFPMRTETPREVGALTVMRSA